MGRAEEEPDAEEIGGKCVRVGGDGGCAGGDAGESGVPKIQRIPGKGVKAKKAPGKIVECVENTN